MICITASPMMGLVSQPPDFHAGSPFRRQPSPRPRTNPKFTASHPEETVGDDRPIDPNSASTEDVASEPAREDVAEGGYRLAPSPGEDGRPDPVASGGAAEAPPPYRPDPPPGGAGARTWAPDNNGFKPAVGVTDPASRAGSPAEPANPEYQAPTPPPTEASTPPPPIESRFVPSAPASLTVADGSPSLKPGSEYQSFAASRSADQSPERTESPPERFLVDRPLAHRHPAAASHPLPRILAIANQKGGVGKTTTAVNLGAALAELEYRVLVVDLDPQGNATTGLGINGRNLDASIYDAMLHDVPIEDVIEPTTLRNLFVVPATIDLAGAEIELVPVFSRELRLRKALQTGRGRLRLHPHRLPAVARPAHRQRPGRRRRGGRADPVRVLRPRRPGPAAPQCRPGPGQPQQPSWRSAPSS